MAMLIPTASHAQEIIPLYKKDKPNFIQTNQEESRTRGMIKNISEPTLEYYSPNEALSTGAAVIVIPGGGYAVVVYDGEGVKTAKALAEKGIAAYVLKYRLPSDSTMVDKKIGPLQDAQQAIKLLRDNAKEWKLDVDKIGVMGFSAGGHLASTLATHFEKNYIDNPEKTNLRPDFQVLVYPVISMKDGLTHSGSRDNLLGKNPSPEDMVLFSNEEQIDTLTPTCYITHAADDNVVDVDNSINYFESMRHHKVEVEMHIYPVGNHGFVFRHEGWMDTLFIWMKKKNLIK